MFSPYGRHAESDIRSRLERGPTHAEAPRLAHGGLYVQFQRLPDGKAVFGTDHDRSRPPRQMIPREGQFPQQSFLLLFRSTIRFAA